MLWSEAVLVVEGRLGAGWTLPSLQEYEASYMVGCADLNMAGRCSQLHLNMEGRKGALEGAGTAAQ